MKVRDYLAVGNTIIFNCDEYNNNNIQQYDGQIQIISDKGVDVIYLSGYRSRNDFIEWSDIIAKVDKRREWVKLNSAPFSGNFKVFNDSINEQLAAKGVE